MNLVHTVGAFKLFKLKMMLIIARNTYPTLASGPPERVIIHSPSGYVLFLSLLFLQLILNQLIISVFLRIESLQLRISNAKIPEGNLVSAGRDAVVKYWNINKYVSSFNHHDTGVTVSFPNLAN